MRISRHTKAGLKEQCSNCQAWRSLATACPKCHAPRPTLEELRELLRQRNRQELPFEWLPLRKVAECVAKNHAAPEAMTDIALVLAEVKM